MHTPLKHILWGILVAGAAVALSVGVYMLQSQGGQWWWNMLVHPHDFHSLGGLLAFPLFSATVIDLTQNLVALVPWVVMLMWVPTLWRTALTAVLVNGGALWLFGHSDHYYFGWTPVVWALMSAVVAFAAYAQRALLVACALGWAFVTVQLLTFEWVYLWAMLATVASSTCPQLKLLLKTSIKNQRPTPQG